MQKVQKKITVLRPSSLTSAAPFLGFFLSFLHGSPTQLQRAPALFGPVWSSAHRPFLSCRAQVSPHQAGPGDAEAKTSSNSFLWIQKPQTTDGPPFCRQATWWARWGFPFPEFHCIWKIGPGGSVVVP